MASGWLGRLNINTKHDFGFNELTELIWVAQKKCRQVIEGDKS